MKQYPFIQGGDVEISHSRLKFKKDIQVSFPLSPCVVKQLVSLGRDFSEMEDVLQAHQLDQIGQTEVQFYLMDVMSHGFSLDPEKFGLFESILETLHRNTLTSLLDFHKLLALSSEWLRAVVAFCHEDFDPLSLGQYLGSTPSPDSLIKLSMTNGILSLPRVNTLSSLINFTSAENHKVMEWMCLYRAAGMIDSLPGRSYEERIEVREQLSSLIGIFREYFAGGLIALLTKSPSFFIKYFLFEIFGVERKIESEALFEAIDHLSQVNLNGRLFCSGAQNTDQELKCGYSFLLQRGLQRFFAGLSPQNTVDVFSKFMNASLSHYSLLVHSAFNVIWEGADSLIPRVLEIFDDKSSFSHTIRMVSAQVVLFLGFSVGEDQLDQHKDLLKNQLEMLLRGPSFVIDSQDARNATLFLVRYWTCNGTIDVQRGLVQAQNGELYPLELTGNKVLDELWSVNKRVSPLDCISQFSDLNRLMVGQDVRVTEEGLLHINSINLPTRAGVVGSLLLGVSPCPIENEKLVSEILEHLPIEITSVLIHLDMCVGSYSDPLKELVLHFMVRIFEESPPFLFFKKMAQQALEEKAVLDHFLERVKEALIPRCPWCRHAFSDFSGCFAVNCRCGYSFCAHCFQKCGKDARPHVESVHGSYLGKDRQFREGFGVLAAQKIQAILRKTPPHLCDLFRSQIPSLLAGNSFFIQTKQVLLEEKNCVMYPWIKVLNQLMTSLSFLFLYLQDRASGAESIEILGLTIEHLLSQIRGQNKSPQLFVHAIFSELAEIGGEAQLDKQGTEAKLNDIFQRNQDLQQFLVNFDAKCYQSQDAKSTALKELQMSEKEIIDYPFDETTRRKYLWLDRSLFNFRSQLWSHVRSNNEKLPLLTFFFEQRNALNKNVTARSYRIVQFLKELQRSAKQKGTKRTEATKEGSFWRFVEQTGEPLINMASEFRSDFVEAMKDLEKFECREEFKKDYDHMEKVIPKDTKLELFLPAKSGPGLLGTALYHGRGGDKEGDWTGLPNVQNELHRLIHHKEGQEIKSCCDCLHPLSPYKMVEKDVVSIRYKEILALINDLFLVPGFHPNLAADLCLVEKLCIDGAPQLGRVPYLEEELPEFQYAGMEGLHNLFRQFHQRLQHKHRKFLPLPSKLAMQFDGLLKSAPHAAQLIFSFCCAVLIQENREDILLDDLVCSIKFDIPLSDEQRLGRKILDDIPTVMSSLQVEHIPALMGFCVRGDLVLDESANVPMSDVDLTSLREGLEEIKNEKKVLHASLPNILSEVRVVGLSHFTKEIGPGFQETPLYEFVEFFFDPDSKFYEDLNGIIPFSVHVCHFGPLWRMLENILGPVELLNKKEDVGKPVSGLGVIPFAALRPFLQSQRVGEDIKEEKVSSFSSPLPNQWKKGEKEAEKEEEE